MGQKIAVIGSTTKEHALVWNLAQHPEVDEIICYAQNAGMAAEPKTRVKTGFELVSPTKRSALLNSLKLDKPDRVIVEQEGILNEGFVDNLERVDLSAYAPTAEAAKLEEDRFYALKLMVKAGAPHPKTYACTGTTEIKQAIADLPLGSGVVIKPRKLLGGLETLLFDSQREALAEVDSKEGKYTQEYIIAERLCGTRFTIVGFADGETVIPVPVALQDTRHLFNNNQGPLTRGMGSFGPVPIIFPYEEGFASEIMTPLMEVMQAEGITYKGFLVASMVLDDTPKVIDWHVRMPDPESQSLLRLMNDFGTPLYAAAEGMAGRSKVKVKPGAACCVMLVDKKHPKGYTQTPIKYVKEANQIEGVKTFLGRSKIEGNQLVSNGGRPIAVTAYGPDIIQARQRAYQAVQLINPHNTFHHRTDIANAGVVLEKLYQQGREEPQVLLRQALEKLAPERYI